MTATARSADGTPADLFTDALAMSVNKNLADITTLLQWAHQARTPSEKRKHIEQALALLEDVAVQLRDMDERPLVF